nr:hypothetical protein [uncultured Oscillibacter sp.]
MAKLDLLPGETLIGSGQMSLYLKQGLSKKPFQGHVFVTNQRACFKISMARQLEMDLPVKEIQGFQVSHMLFITKVTICARNGDTYSLTGFPAKKLQSWLEKAGVKRL